MRRAFTLTEMLVVIFIMLTLAALTVSLLPKFNQGRLLARGADELQGYLLIAKSRARRDQLPTGVRLTPDASGLVRVVQLIQQPDWFAGGTIYSNRMDLTIVQTEDTDFTGGFADSNLYPVQPGDYLEVLGGGVVHRITAVFPQRLQLASPVVVFINFQSITNPDGTQTRKGTANYHIVRQPRILTGETPLELPADIAIDLGTNQQFNGPLPPPRDGSVDLLFIPGGALADCAGGFCPLWVRDTSQDTIWQGEPRIICIYPRTGQIAAHPVNDDHTNPYAFCADGRSSGL